uniref:Putative non-structural NS1 n=1 Tax=Millport starfish parvo-like virus 1 TaxID=2021901 RepID=A0A221LFN0_9VIRU|nr:putative non-structural NS1 [Millport starfish parvo-like virus 1]
MASEQVNNYLVEARVAVKKYLFTAATIKQGVKLAPLVDYSEDGRFNPLTISDLLPTLGVGAACNPCDIKQKSCLHAIWEYRAGLKAVHHEPGFKMKEYMEKYATRPLQMNKLMSAQEFCNEYQHKKHLCHDYKFVGIVLSSKSERCTVGTMISKAQNFLQSLDPDYGYLVTLHDPSIDTVQKLDLYEHDNMEFNDALIKAHFGPDCPEATIEKKVPDSKTKMTTKMSPNSCFKGEVPEHISPIHLHIVIWHSNRARPVLTKNKYRTLKQDTLVYVEGQTMYSGSQALQYATCPPRFPVCLISDYHNNRQDNDIPVRFLVRDFDGLLRRWEQFTSVVSYMEISVNKAIERAAKIAENAPLYKGEKETPKEFLFNLFYRIMLRYGETDIDMVPELKRHMKVKGDVDLLALHRATINPQQSRPIWNNAVSHYKGVEHNMTLHDYIEKYENRYGDLERFDEANNDMIMSKADSIKAMEEFLRFHGHSKEDWLQLVHSIFNKTTQNKKNNALCIWGDSNAGKSWIMAPIQKVCNSYTVIGGGASDESNFKFMGMVGKRWALFNEMIVSDNNAEKMKEILGGENAEVAVKFAGNTRIGRVPCIITCNNPPFKYVSDGTNRQALKNRCVIYRWRKFNWGTASWNNKSASLHPGCYSMREINEQTTFVHYEAPMPTVLTDNIVAVIDSMMTLLNINKVANKGMLVMDTIVDIVHNLIGGDFSEQQATDFWGHLVATDSHDIHTCLDAVCNEVYQIRRTPTKQKPQDPGLDCTPHLADETWEVPETPPKRRKLFITETRSGSPVICDENDPTSVWRAEVCRKRHYIPHKSPERELDIIVPPKKDYIGEDYFCQNQDEAASELGQIDFEPHAESVSQQ